LRAEIQNVVALSAESSVYFLPLLLSSAGDVDIHWVSCPLRDETLA
jgi:hypothetical protein